MFDCLRSFVYLYDLIKGVERLEMEIGVAFYLEPSRGIQLNHIGCKFLQDRDRDLSSLTFAYND